MTRDFLKQITQPRPLGKALRRVMLGATMTATGLLGHQPTVAANTEPRPEPTATVGATIVNRSKKAAKLVLQLPGALAYRITAHRSHSSHRSHYSSSSGGTTTPRKVPPPPPPTEKTEITPRSLVATDAAVSGVIESINVLTRSFVIKQTTTSVRKSYGYRDDTKYFGSTGVGLRFDELAEANDGALPISVGQKVEVQWRIAADGVSQIATVVHVSKQ